MADCQSWPVPVLVRRTPKKDGTRGPWGVVDDYQEQMPTGSDYNHGAPQKLYDNKSKHRRHDTHPFGGRYRRRAGLKMIQTTTTAIVGRSSTRGIRNHHLLQSGMCSQLWLEGPSFHGHGWHQQPDDLR